MAGDHRRQAARIGRRRLVRAQDFGARRAAEQLDAALDRVDAALGLDRMHVGGIDEVQLAGIVARPDRRRHGVDQRLQRGHVVGLLAVALRQLRQLVFDAGDFAQPQDRAAADHLPVGLDGAAVERRQRQLEALAAGAQRIDRTLHLGRPVRPQPGAERQDAVRLAGRRRSAPGRR